MTPDVQSGYLLIADISGYTKFLAESELEHAKVMSKWPLI